MAKATVEGMQRFKAHVASLPMAVHLAMSDAIEKGSDELVAMQQRLAPVAHIDGGELRDSIKREWAGPTTSESDRAQQLAAKGAADLAMIVSAGNKIAYYARWVEHGTSLQPAQPFFFVAYRTLKKRINARITRAMRKAMRGK